MPATQAEIDALRAAIYSGIKAVTITFGPRSTTTTYQNFEDMWAALTRLEAELAVESDPTAGRPRQHLAFQSGNGF